MTGSDGRPWVVVSIARNGRTPRWMPYTSTTLNGLRALTVDYLARHIGKPVVIYEVSASNSWPNKASEVETYTFVPDGNAQLITRKTPYLNWLRTRSPRLPAKGYVSVTGTRISSSESDMDREWGPIITGNGELATSNPRSTQSFVRAS